MGSVTTWRNMQRETLRGNERRFYLYLNGLHNLFSILLYRAIQQVRTEATRDNNFGS
jgi:hypothetical protein